MRVKQERELATVLVSAVRAVAVRVHSFEIRLVLCVTIIPLWMPTVSVDMVVMFFLLHVLEDEELPAFRNIEWLKPDVFVKNFETPEFVHLFFGGLVIAHFAVLVVYAIFDSHNPTYVMFGSNRPASSLSQNPYCSLRFEL